MPIAYSVTAFFIKPSSSKKNLTQMFLFADFIAR
jgi:hypothetical protein